MLKQGLKTSSYGTGVRAKMKGWLMQQSADCWAWLAGLRLQRIAVNRIWSLGNVSLSAMLSLACRCDSLHSCMLYMCARQNRRCPRECTSGQAGHSVPDLPCCGVCVKDWGRSEASAMAAQQLRPGFEEDSIRVGGSRGPVTKPLPLVPDQRDAPISAAGGREMLRVTPLVGS